MRHTVAGGSLVAAEWPKSTEFAGDPRRRKGVVGLDAALPGSVWLAKRKQGTAVVRSSTETRRGGDAGRELDEGDDGGGVGCVQGSEQWRERGKKWRLGFDRGSEERPGGRYRRWRGRGWVPRHWPGPWRPSALSTPPL